MDVVPYLLPICQYELVKASLQFQPSQVQIEEKKTVAPPTDMKALFSKSETGSLLKGMAGQKI